MKKISIIIPVYNGENNILNCYESINNQTIESLEIIFINDGSTDKSLDIIKEIKLKDDRVIIIDQKNQGVSSARNNGIKVATSEYISFIDVDDIIYPEYYSKLLSNINNNEIIISNILLEKDNVLKQKTSFFDYDKIYDKKDINEKIIPRLLCIEDLTLLPCWNKLYKRSFLIENNIFFLKNLVLEEDGVFNCLAFSKCNKLTFINYAGYIYKDNEESVTRNFIDNNIFEKNEAKYFFDYNEHVDLNISKSELTQFQSSKLIFASSFLIYKAILNNKISFVQKQIYITKILNNKTVIKANKNLHTLYLKERTKFELIISKSICYRTKISIYPLIMIGYLLNFKFFKKILTLINK